MDGLETKDNADDFEPRDPAKPGTREPLTIEGEAVPVPPAVRVPASAAVEPPARDNFSPSPASFVRPALQATRSGEQAPKEITKPGTTFCSDRAEGEDALNLTPLLAPLADLVLRRGTETPLTIGLLGGSGAGKSFALGKILAAVEALNQSASGGVFVAPVLTVKIDAAALSEAPSVALAGAIYDALARDFPAVAREAAHAVRDPHLVAREAADQLDIERRRLDAERQTLSEIESRRARLPEVILFEQAGSHVDSYARSIRARIESRLESFGLTGDPVKNYKSLVRDMAESGGPSARIGVALRAFWAFKGQTRLLITALIFVLIALGCGAAVDHQAGWLESLRAKEAFVPTADWLQAHIDWFSVIGEFCWFAAAAAVVINLWRGIRFLRPLFRGVGLLQTEVTERRRDLDSLLAHQMRRVDALSSDVELTARRASEADRRAATATAANSEHAEPSPFASMTPESQADRFFAALARVIPPEHDRAVGANLPSRVVIGLDNIDRVPEPRRQQILDTAMRLFSQKSFVTILAVDSQRLSDASALEKWIDIPLNLAAMPRDGAYVGLVSQLLGDERTQSKAPAKSLDWSVSADEANVLKMLAPLAGASPRAAKRFVNLYRIARIGAPDNLPMLAFMLALDQGGSDVDRAMVEAALAGNDDVGQALDLRSASPGLASALATVEAAHGRVTKDEARRVMATAQIYSLRN
ncbi:MAG TPA: P-loop NTPase fold protein [Methylovirgula sp.]